MNEFLAEYGLFMAKWVGAAAVLLLFLIGLMAAFGLVSARARAAAEMPLQVRSLNRKYREMTLTLKSVIQPGSLFKRTLRDFKKRQKQDAKQAMAGETRRKVYVLKFIGDLRASGVSSLREEITAVLGVAEAGDEAVVLLESAGGLVHDYGLAASQLRRIRDRGIRLTVAVDKVAASGGYMMACVADRIIAAPFAVLGSVGVVGQLPNFHRFLKNRDIDFEQVTAGEYKRTLTLFGETTDKKRELFREEIENAHGLFKAFVHENRPQLDMDEIANGRHWFGSEALALKLVDALQTSDDYLYQATDSADLYAVSYEHKKPFLAKLLAPFSGDERRG